MKQSIITELMLVNPGDEGLFRQVMRGRRAIFWVPGGRAGLVHSSVLISGGFETWTRRTIYISATFLEFKYLLYL